MFTTKPQNENGTASASPNANPALTIDSLESGYEQRSVSEAYDEAVRELEVRQRVYVRWVRDGKLSETDARDRIQRLICAVVWLRRLVVAPAMFRQELESAAPDTTGS